MGGPAIPPGNAPPPGPAAPVYPPPPAYPPPYGYPVVPGGSSYSPGFAGGPPPGVDWAGVRAAERRGLRALRIAAILGLVASLVGFFGFFAVPAITGSSPLYSGAPMVPANGSLNSSFFNNSTFFHGLNRYVGAFAAVVVASLVVAIASTYFYRQAFLALRPIDPGKFSSPATFAVVLIVGALLAMIGIGLVYGGLSAFSGCAPPSNTFRNGCAASMLAYFAGGALLLVVAAILAIIGIIGTAIGIWRYGSRYSSTLLQVGSILYLFLGFIGAILILVGATSAEDRVESAPAGPTPPPPGPSFR